MWIRDRRLTRPTGAPIDLGRGHGVAQWHSFALNPAGTRLLVASEHELEEAEEVAFEYAVQPHHTVFDHVNLETGVVTRLGRSEQPGYVMAHGEDAYLVGLGTHRHVGFAVEFESMPVTPLPLQ